MNRPARTIANLVAFLALAWPAWGATQRDETEYRIRPRDIVEISVEQAPNLGGEFVVGNKGTIDHPLLGPLPMAGSTQSQAKDQLVTRLEELYFQKGQARSRCTLRVRQGGTQTIRILGAVNSPKEYALPNPPALLQALLDAGGVLEANAGVARVLRTAGNGLSDQVEVPLQPLLSGLDPRWNVTLRPNDVVMVPAQATITVYMLGEFGSQGPIALESQSATLLTAVIRAGGLAARASRRLTIKRKQEDGTYQSENYDYKAILKGRLPDIKLRDGDIVQAGLSFF